jgi:hypothetical protein
MSGLMGALWLAATMTSTAAAQSGDTVAGLPNYYEVQPGDTLWEIATVFLGDPYYWPRLWSVNAQITNPHWIYPGNRIYFTLGTNLDAPRIGSDPNQPPVPGPVITNERTYACGPDVRFTDEWASDVFSAPGFLADRRDVEIYGSVEHANSIYKHLAEDDLLYLKVEDPDAFECGDVVSVFRRVRRQVRHPDTRREKFGSMYVVMGEAIVVHRYGDYISARVRDSLSEIVRGDLVGPQMPLRVEVEIREPIGDLQGTIVERLNYEAVLTGTREIVFIDRGSADGIRQGDSFFITQQRDDFYGGEDRKLPPSVIGRVVVLNVDSDSATAVITDAAVPIQIGDRISQEVD